MARAWTTWLMLGGRGAGKTRTGAEFVRALVHGHAPYAEARHGSIALVGETEHDVREVMIEGPRRPAAHLAAQRAPALDRHAPAAGMGKRRGGLRLLGRGPRAVARAAVRRRLVRRARQVAPCRRHLRHAAIRPAPGRAPAPARHHHAAADRADQAPGRRSAHRADACRHASQRRASVARVSR